MKASHSINALSLILFAAMLSLPLTALALAGPAQDTASPQATQNDQAVLQLGKVEVKGQRQIIKTLQAIKVALRTPDSSDPKLQNAVICRITNDIGSHANQILTCATNRTLAKRRMLTQIAMMIPVPAGSRAQARFDILNEFLQDMPSNILHIRVNGPAVRALLRKIPDPAPEASSMKH